jgi:hypothetical protein
MVKSRILVSWELVGVGYRVNMFVNSGYSTHHFPTWISLKGQSHEKVFEIMTLDGRIGLN